MIKELLQTLKMKGALEALARLSPKVQEQKWLITLLQAEVKSRITLANKRRLSKAQFPVQKEWCEIDPTLNPSIDFSQIEQLGQGEFITKKENLCFIGQQGTGKTHSLIALGRQLCRKGLSVKFYSACALVNQLEEAKMNNTLSKLMKTLVTPQLLIIDELGFVPFSENGARLLFDVFASRYERGSIGVSTNLSFDQWIQVFGTPELTTALIDRFTHQCIIYSFQGDSVRFLEASKRKNNNVLTQAHK